MKPSQTQLLLLTGLFTSALFLSGNRQTLAQDSATTVRAEMPARHSAILKT